ncbi:MAG: hypothetical protein R2822_23815 [Spirosomataceae bacterium]
MKQLLSVVGMMTLLLLVNATNKPTTQCRTSRQRLGATQGIYQEYLDAIPEDGHPFKPTPKFASFAEQMMHLADANFGFTAAATGKQSPMARGARRKQQRVVQEAVIKTV